MTETPAAPPAEWSDAKRALLASRLRGARQRTAAPTPTVPRRAHGAAPPLSSGQERLWFMEQFAPGGGAAYALAPSRRLRGPLDRAALEAALGDLVARHESLRMSFPTTEEGTARVVVGEPRPVELEYAPADSAADAAARIRTALAEPFDLADGPLLRALLLRLGPDDHVLTLQLHHIVCDGWSVDLLQRELDALYAEHALGRPAELPALPVQFGDYAAWQRARLQDGTLAADRAYWQTELADVPALDLPADRPRPSVLTFAGAGHGFAWDGELTERLGALARARGASLYMVLMTAYQVLLSRLSGQQDFAVGSPVAGRSHRELEGVIGAFVNMLPIRARLTGDPSFAEAVDAVRDRTLEAYAHQEVPFEQIVADLPVERDVSRSAVFQTTFAFQNYGDRAARPADTGLGAEEFGFEGSSTHFDLALYLSEQPDGLSGLFTYRTDLFDQGTVEALAERFRLLVTAAVAAPDRPVSQLPLLTEAEAAAVLGAWATGPELPEPAPDAGPRTLTALLAATAAAHPDAPALVFADETLSYRELDGRANRLARRLRAFGVRPDDRVAVCLEQSPALAVGMLAALKAGACYLPLDPEQPPARLAFLLRDADVRVLVTDEETRPLFPEYQGPELLLDGDLAADESDAPLDEASGPDDLAYVIYTSGSTGQPKGVAVQHRQIVNYLAGVAPRLRIEPGGSYALLQSLSFDFSITMLYLALTTGGRVHLLPRRIAGAELADELERLDIDYLKMTPSHLAALTADAPVERLLPRRALVLGGEASAYGWARELAAVGRCAVFNHYGPTEATVGITVHEVLPEPDPVGAEGSTPIGRPLAGARCYVLDRTMRPVPPGVPGELYLGGDRLARGYLDRPELTEERFLPDPFGPPGARLYRTGDLARWRRDGTLDFLGRGDHQIKVRGYRVEPGEIEAALCELPGVVQAVVLARGAGVKQQLVAWLERPGAGEPLAPAEIRTRLLGTLPDYMVPARYVTMERFPLQAHGKVDRRALPEPETEVRTGHEPPVGAEEERIAEMWADLLDVPRVGALDDFFELGGHSLLATQVVARIRRAFPELPVPVTVMDLFQHSTVRALAGLVGSLLAEPDADRGPRRLLHRLTPARPVQASLVCAPYGGGSALIYKPLADALPEDWALHSLAVPGHEIGEEAMPVDEIAAGCVREILESVEGRIVLYGHCGLGVMLTVEIARRLEAAGREVEAVHLAGVFPFARPRTRGAALAERAERLAERLRSDQNIVNHLTAAGLDVEDFTPEQLRLIVANRRAGTRAAEQYFTELFEDAEVRLKAPVIAVVGDRDPAAEFYQERYREWLRITDTAAAVVLDEAGHFFLKYRAEELAAVLTQVHRSLAEGTEERLRRRPDATWWLVDVTRPGDALPTGPDRAVRPSMRRFLTVAAGQQVSMIGSALTEFAVPVWLYLHTGSLAQYGLLAACGLVPGILAAPLAGAVVDRGDRRRIMLAGDLASGATQAAMLALALTGTLQVWHVYLLVAVLSAALTFQRFAWGSAVPQLVPKRYLGRANGVVQMAFGFAQFLVPLFAVGLLAAVGLRGILGFDVASYLFAVGVVLCVRFPAAMPWTRRESIGVEIRAGFRRSLGSRHFRAMLVWFAVLNVFLSPLFLLTTPLALSVGRLAETGWVAMCAGLGATLGGLTLLVWGGPRRRRLRGLLAATAALGAAAVLTGLRPSIPLVAAGAFGMALGLAVLNGIYATIIQTKVPQRFHGRVIAVNTMIAWSTLPLGFAVVAPFGPALLQPLMARHGALASTFGVLLGTGPGRGIGLLYLLFGLAIALLAVAGLRVRALARFDDEVPDALADDLVGLEALKEKSH
ncbi:non-ribosomal peptide synthetase/MFS transporter [Streptacidiphilus jiangxiensis]|uniref:Amino acid adenylation domain-containing protein n=1 Tax=Streptacidiphilus jiangxiensis TaxID=235985 RepID=A0A1H7G1Q5_STRJI|nr:non-ribosomal peptide synthetase/MFS transporter [Streptacidiphilus jiangxiensis]SEK31457.1 amino acid adenylation domain-containing protein [Streptacidiphilus jiangxiensis]